MVVDISTPEVTAPESDGTRVLLTGVTNGVKKGAAGRLKRQINGILAGQSAGSGFLLRAGGTPDLSGALVELVLVAGVSDGVTISAGRFRGDLYGRTAR